MLFFNPTIAIFHMIFSYGTIKTKCFSFLKQRYHENCRIFQDRLVNDEDRVWFRKLLEEKLVESFEIRFDEVVTRSPLFYGDFMIPSAEVKLYHEITDEGKVNSDGFSILNMLLWANNLALKM